MAAVKFREGDLFAVPLAEGGYAVGLLARASRTGVLLGYFFGPRHDELPSLNDVEGLQPAEAIMVGKFGYLGLRGGTWPILGRLEEWDRDTWPMPIFIRRELFSGRIYKIIYDPDNPNKRIRSEQVPPGIEVEGPQDKTMGHISVENTLTAMLADSPQ